jgi:hypothetical protein
MKQVTCPLPCNLPLKAKVSPYQALLASQSSRGTRGRSGHRNGARKPRASVVARLKAKDEERRRMPEAEEKVRWNPVLAFSTGR